MNIEEIRNIVTNGEENKIDIKLRDIAYVILSQSIDSSEIVYKILFGENSTQSMINEYANSLKIAWIEKYISTIEIDEKETISFDENREGVEKELDVLEKYRTENELDPKELVAISGRILDARKILNDKFGVNEKSSSKLIMVNSRCNDICPICQHEVRAKEILKEIPMSKEEAMKRYNLIPNNNIYKR